MHLVPAEAASWTRRQKLCFILAAALELWMLIALIIELRS
jgi:hypothetical protein